jgi:predicted MPP superfamily phosphohydrolase
VHPTWRITRWLLGIAGALILLALALLGFAYWQALRDPIVREASIVVPDWPRGEPPRTVLLITDTHVAGPDMPPERLARIMDGLNRLKPDLVLLAGDYISEKEAASRYYEPREIVAALARLRARFGVVAVLGNHDHWADPDGFRRAFAAHHVPLLANAAIRRGPFVIGGIDDVHSGHADLPATLRAMAALGAGPRLILTHSPDIIPAIDKPAAAIFAGHTHCGQIALPLIGAPVTMSAFGQRFVCGEIHESGKTIFVSAGLGTSLLPLRLGAPPDVWLVRFGPAAGAAR